MSLDHRKIFQGSLDSIFFLFRTLWHFWIFYLWQIIVLSYFDSTFPLNCNKALDAVKAFLESHRTDKGVLSAEDDATYTKMEADIDALTNEIHRLERQEQREAEMSIVPQYYVEGNHEAIIPREIYMRVQEELVRRRVVKTSANGKKRSYSCNHCFSQIIICGDCGEMFRRIH